MRVSSDRRAATPLPDLGRGHRWAGLLGPLLLVILLFTAFVPLAKLVRVALHAGSLVSQAYALGRWARDPSVALRSSTGRAALRAGLGTMREDLAVLQVEGRPLGWALRYAGALPLVGGDLQALPSLFQAGIRLTDAGLAALWGLEPVLAVYDPGSGVPPENVTPELLWRLKTAQPHLAEAERAVAEAQLHLDRVSALRLSRWLAPPVSLAHTYVPALRAALGLAQAAPVLLGADRPATYLILAQNDHELRPTGGVISGAGLLRIDGARVISATLEDSYAADADCAVRVAPPAPLREYMWAPALKLRDANWSPDLPSSLAVVRSIYSGCRGIEVDGVIVVDLQAVAVVLDLLGPLQPPGYETPVTGATFQAFLAQYWANPAGAQTMSENKDQWWLHRKDLMRDLLHELVLKTESGLGSIPVRRAAPELVRLLQERRLQVYLDEPSARAALAAAGWDGAIRPTAGDYLLVADANLGFRKVNPSIERVIDYRVAPGSGGGPAVTLTLEYRNSSPGPDACIAGARYDETYNELMQGCYWNYLRVYIPRGSRVLSVAGGDSAVSLDEERGRAVLGMLLIVPPGQSRRVVLVYQPPEAGEPLVARELLIQKQAGLPEGPLRVALPDEGRILACHGCASDAAVHGSVLTTTLSRDVRLVWAEPARPGNGPDYRLLLPGLALLAVAGFLARARRA